MTAQFFDEVRAEFHGLLARPVRLSDERTQYGPVAPSAQAAPVAPVAVAPAPAAAGAPVAPVAVAPVALDLPASLVALDQATAPVRPVATTPLAFAMAGAQKPRRTRQAAPRATIAPAVAVPVAKADDWF